jgi:hypothetical protein
MFFPPIHAATVVEETPQTVSFDFFVVLDETKKKRRRRRGRGGSS